MTVSEFDLSYIDVRAAVVLAEVGSRRPKCEEASSRSDRDRQGRFHTSYRDTVASARVRAAHGVMPDLSPGLTSVQSRTASVRKQAFASAEYVSGGKKSPAMERGESLSRLGHFKVAYIMFRVGEIFQRYNLRDDPHMLLVYE